MLFDVAAVYEQCSPEVIGRMIRGFLKKCDVLNKDIDRYVAMISEALRNVVLRGNKADDGVINDLIRFELY